ncbi:hypothetical protein [Lignipirellula cremea]|uniref:hypothetical protein n=1 Tax=Lignipirellula cremea TaxID=2528010 RepID=UPI0011A47D7E|nr:hypothetical protein [Lignipirellula cremea]
MTSHVLNPCPQCGRRFDFPLTGCMTFVAESLIANSNGKCPECGTPVVVDQPLPTAEHVDSLAAAQTDSEKRDVKIVDLPLSIRCRLQIHKMNIETLGGLLQISKDAVRQQLAESPTYIDDIQSMLDEHGLKWQP